MTGRILERLQDTLINKIIHKCAILSCEIQEMLNTNTVTILAKFIKPVVRKKIGVTVRLNPLRFIVKCMIKDGGITLKFRCQKYVRKRIILLINMWTKIKTGESIFDGQGDDESI